MTLYLKYRPQILEELDLVDVRNSLEKIMQSSNKPHAFLFAGPKGTGKTSAARIIARMFNCEENSKKTSDPCQKCEQCISIAKGANLDVIELDAASNRGIDDVRSLKEAVKLSPAKARKKVYIIDEAHMLTTEASNALLKTLEEPPDHVVFILATTNPEKLISTIRSRTTEVIFRKATQEEIENSLKRVIKSEGIKISPETLTKVAAKANGSFRDGVKALEQFTLEGESFLEKSEIINLDSFVELLFKKDLPKLLEIVQNGAHDGVNIADFVKSVLGILHKRLLREKGSQSEQIILIELLLTASNQIGDSPIEELPLEIALIKWASPNDDGDNDEDEKEEEVMVNNHDNNVSIQVEGENLDDGTWKSILTAVRPVNASIEALLRAARPINFNGKVLTLGVYYKFHKERLEDVHYRKILEDVVATIVGNPIKIMCMLTEPLVKIEEPKTVLTESEDKDIIKAAEEIFGV